MTTVLSVRGGGVDRTHGCFCRSCYACRMLALLLSTVAFFVAAYFTRRWLDDMGIPKTMTRSIVIFVAAAAASYAVAFVVDLVIV